MNAQGFGTTQYHGVTWDGDGFAENEAQRLWERFPGALKEIVRVELKLGNTVLSMLDNKERGIVLISMKEGPLTKVSESEDVKVHNRHSPGNYCYDGTKATYEDLNTGCFLAFEDPDYENEIF